jgi:hypothetical protein
MKFLVVLALFAAAAAEPESYGSPEADPYYFYNGYTGYHPYTYGYGFPYHTYHHVPAVKAVEKAAEEVPEVVEKKAAVVAPYYYAHPYATYTHPYAAYTHPYAAYTHAVKPYAYYANSGGAVHAVHKREAEAEADADPKSWYGYHGYSPYTYGYGYGNYGHYNGAYSPYRYASYRYGAYSPYHYGGYYYGK